MKTIILLVSAMMFSCSLLYAQSEQQNVKEVKAFVKHAEKMAKKAAKEYRKDGWKAAIGSKPMEIQLKDLYLRQGNGEIVSDYIIGVSEAIAGSDAAARALAASRARDAIATQINDLKVTWERDNTTENVQTSQSDVSTLQSEHISSGQIIEELNLGRTEIIMQIYRKVGDNIQYQIGISCQLSVAKDILSKMK